MTGPSQCGKSTFGTALTEQMARKGFEFCVIDPEGDYVGLEHCVGIGGTRIPPRLGEVLGLLHDADVNLVLHTQSLSVRERAQLFSALIVQGAHLRARTGRPHWLVIDEAHQVLPSDRARSWRHLSGDIPASILITAFPQLLPHEVLATLRSILILGDRPAELLNIVAREIHVAPPRDTPSRSAAKRCCGPSAPSGRSWFAPPCRYRRIGAMPASMPRETSAPSAASISVARSGISTYAPTISIASSTLPAASTTPHGSITCERETIRRGSGT